MILATLLQLQPLFLAGKFVHHDPRKPVEHSTAGGNNGMVSPAAAASADGGGTLMNGNGLVGQVVRQQQTVLSNEALKVACPFCESMFAARYGFYQHLCDKHFKEPLAAQVPANPPFLCPVAGCGYVARDSRQVTAIILTIHKGFYRVFLPIIAVIFCYFNEK